MKKKRNFRQGAASFYMVAIATLVLVIAATSFAAVIISEIARTSNDDLAQSAYDSAMAGVEDAKLAYYNYRKCLEGGVSMNGEMTCNEIIEYVNNNDLDCGMVGRILGRIGLDSNDEVIIKETNEGDNNMQQAYTCVNIKTELYDYITRLSGNNSIEVVKVILGEGRHASEIKSIRVSWNPINEDAEYNYTNFDEESGMVVFPSLENAQLASPPTIEVGLIQTAEAFNLSDFDMTKIENGKSVTDRGTLYLVPTNSLEGASVKVDGNHAAGYDESKGKNYIDKAGFLKSNDKTASNLPYTVYCPRDGLSDFVCSATIELPEPVGGVRNDETFMIIVNAPYGAPDMDVSLEFCKEENGCTEMERQEDGSSEEINALVPMEGMQIVVDSTGRANDLYRRVEMRFNLQGDGISEYSKYAVQLFQKDSSSGFLINKDLPTTCEWDFSPTCQ